MRFLLSSLLLIFYVSCASYPKKNNFKSVESRSPAILNPYFSNTSRDYVYKASINAFDRNFGGIFIVKKLGANHHRIVFTTELGNKIFDFSFKGNDFKVNHIIKEFDKKLLINILRNDFKILVLENPSVIKTFKLKKDTIYRTNILGKDCFHYQSQGFINKVIKVKNGKNQVEFLFSEINDDLARQIEINHQNLRLSIGLKSI